MDPIPPTIEWQRGRVRLVDQRALPGELRFESPRPVGGTVLDTLFGGLPGNAERTGCVATLSHRGSLGHLTVTADRSFRELLLFTPPHRQSIAIEPYTCASDAPNLAAQGIDCGWQILTPGQRWESVVEYRWNPSGFSTG